MMSACPREKSHILASPVAGEEVVLSPLLYSVLPFCAVLFALVSKLSREQNSHHTVSNWEEDAFLPF